MHRRRSSLSCIIVSTNVSLKRLNERPQISLIIVYCIFAERRRRESGINLCGDANVRRAVLVTETAASHLTVIIN